MSIAERGGAAGFQAQQILVERFLSWERVQERLQHYPAIQRNFPLDLLRRHRVTPPYF